jgi:hypothetical protein
MLKKLKQQKRPVQVLQDNMEQQPLGLNQQVKKIGEVNLNLKFREVNLFKLRKNVKNSHIVIKVILKPLRYMRMRRLRKLLKILVKNTILVRM